MQIIEKTEIEFRKHNLNFNNDENHMKTYLIKAHQVLIK